MTNPIQNKYANKFREDTNASPAKNFSPNILIIYTSIALINICDSCPSAIPIPTVVNVLHSILNSDLFFFKINI
ncbi:hypothetical protein CBOS2020_37200 (plasmid) [Clostridium botulinum]|nr:hypothetical protein CBOS2020_37200 [Clostridium botulinum]